MNKLKAFIVYVDYNSEEYKQEDSKEYVVFTNTFANAEALAIRECGPSFLRITSIDVMDAIPIVD